MGGSSASASFYFNPRAPCGARRRPPGIMGCAILFQPTRPLRGATIDKREKEQAAQISTHAPLAGRDFALRLLVNTKP